MHIITLYSMIGVLARLASPIVEFGAAYGVHALLRRGQRGAQDCDIDVKCRCVSIHTRVDRDGSSRT